MVRGSGLSATMSKYLIDEIARTSNIVLEPLTQVVEALGEDHLKTLRLFGPRGDYEVPAGSLFVFIGAQDTRHKMATGKHPSHDENGFVLLLGPDLRARGKLPDSWKDNREPFLLETSVPGVFVAGDVRHGSVKRVALRQWRGLYCSAVCPPVSGWVLVLQL